MIRHALVGIGMALGLSGCGAPFLHSAPMADAVTDESIVGKWAAAEPMELDAVISATQGAPYSLSLTARDKGVLKTSLSIDLTLCRIGDGTYADLFLARPERDRVVETYGFLAVPVHQIMKISIGSDTLTVWRFRGEWLADAAQATPFSHDRVAVGGGEVAIVTAPTPQIRELLAQHGNDPSAFGDPIVFRRVR
jgi:hypothetical protein